MKLFVVLALCVAAASAYAVPPSAVVSDIDKIQEILNAINHPSTDPATAALLEQMLLDIVGIQDSPISVGPAIVEEDDSPISVGPAIIEENDSPISVGPALVDESVVSEGPSPQSSPLVQVIVNVKGNNPGNLVDVVQNPEIVPTPVNVVEQPEIEPTPVIVIEQPEVPEPVQVAPVIVPGEPVVQPDPVIIDPSPVINLPDILN